MAEQSRPLTDKERESLYQFVVGNEALAGHELDEATARRIFEQAIRKPLLDFGGKHDADV